MKTQGSGLRAKKKPAMGESRVRGRRKASAVQTDLLAILQETTDSKELLQKLEELSSEQSFNGHTHLWGPELYSRAPKLFRPFILRHFSTYIIESDWRWKNVAWKGKVAERLETWLEAVDKADDIELFQRLYSWKHQGSTGKKTAQTWQKELLDRFRKAEDHQARQTELSKMELWFWLEQETAISLYQTDPELAAPFIIKHLPREYGIFSGEKRKMWAALAKIAKEKEDLDFYFRLYREQIPIKQWTAESLALCSSIQNADKLVQELQRRHPNVWSADLGETYCQLLELRGEDLFPYIIPELRRVARGWFRGSYEKLIQLALKNEWLELWAGLLRTCSSPKEYNKAILEVLKLGTKEARRRLLLLAGMGQEWNFGSFGIASYRPLDDTTAIAVHKQFPELLRGPLKAQLSPNWQNTYPKFLQTLIEAEDEELLDYLASRLVTFNGNWGQGKVLKAAEMLADYYESFQNEAEAFARRSAAVISQVPPYVFWDYNGVIRSNRLARLLYERRPAGFLASTEAVLDLLESPEIRAQILAYKILGLKDPRARELAHRSQALLLGTLYRPIHRKTRIVAFKALKNSVTDIESAARLLNAAREACFLPDIRYPKGDLVRLIAELLYRYPELQSEEEQAVIYGVKGASPCSA